MVFIALLFEKLFPAMLASLFKGLFFTHFIDGKKAGAGLSVVVRPADPKGAVYAAAGILAFDPLHPDNPGIVVTIAGNDNPFGELFGHLAKGILDQALHLLFVMPPGLHQGFGDTPVFAIAEKS